MNLINYFSKLPDTRVETRKSHKTAKSCWKLAESALTEPAVLKAMGKNGRHQFISCQSFTNVFLSFSFPFVILYMMIRSVFIKLPILQTHYSSHVVKLESLIFAIFSSDVHQVQQISKDFKQCCNPVKGKSHVFCTVAHAECRWLLCYGSGVNYR